MLEIAWWGGMFSLVFDSKIAYHVPGSGFDPQHQNKTDSKISLINPHGL